MICTCMKWLSSTNPHVDLQTHQVSKILGTDTLVIVHLFSVEVQTDPTSSEIRPNTYLKILRSRTVRSDRRLIALGFYLHRSWNQLEGYYGV